MSQTLSLYRLQQTDTRLDQVQARLQAIQKILKDDAMLREANVQSEVAEKSRLAAERAMLKAENAVEAQRVKIEQSEASLYGGQVHNPKELQDLENEVAALKRYLVTLEDRLLEAMLACEEAEAAHKAAQEALQAARARWADQNQSLGQEGTALQKESEKLIAERQAIASAISEENLVLYDELRHQRRGVAVAGITENACDACGAVLTPAQQQAACSASQMMRCPSCGRILYGS